MEIRVIEHPDFAGHKHDKEGRLVSSAPTGSSHTARYLIEICPECGTENTLSCVIDGVVHSKARPVCVNPECGRNVGNDFVRTALCTLQKRDEYIEEMKKSPTKAEPKGKKGKKEEVVFEVPNNFPAMEVIDVPDAALDKFIAGGNRGDAELQP